jgi:hypothetical protein
MKSTCTEDDADSLRRYKQRIETAYSELSNAETQRGRVLARANDDEAQLVARFLRLDPDDAASIASIAAERVRIGVLKDWCGSAPRVKAAISALSSTLQGALPSIQAACQMRDGEEFGISVSTATLQGELSRLHMQPNLIEQIANVRRVAETVQSSLGVLLRARKPAMLTRQEREDGLIRDLNGSTVLRRAYDQERMSGYANV